MCIVHETICRLISKSSDDDVTFYVRSVLKANNFKTDIYCVLKGIVFQAKMKSLS